MPTLQDRIVWITGIGRAIANGFAAAGARVALTGRRVDALAQTASEIGQAAIVAGRCDQCGPGRGSIRSRSKGVGRGRCAGEQRWREFQ